MHRAESASRNHGAEKSPFLGTWKPLRTGGSAFASAGIDQEPMPHRGKLQNRVGIYDRLLGEDPADVEIEEDVEQDGSSEESKGEDGKNVDLVADGLEIF